MSAVEPAEYHRKFLDVSEVLREIANKHLDEYSLIQELPDKGYRNMPLRTETGPFSNKDEFNSFVRDVEGFYGLKRGCLSINLGLRRAKTIAEMARKISTSRHYQPKQQIIDKQTQTNQKEVNNLAELVYSTI